MPYLINGSAASLAPYSQAWRDIPIGRTLRGETKYSVRKECDLDFDSCALAHYKQWEDVVNGGSLLTLTILNPDSTTFAAYSGVYLDFAKRPTQESALAFGPWTITVRDILA